MGKPVLFVCGLGNDLQRAENMSALYNAYPGEKLFISAGNHEFGNIVGSGKYDLMVIDIFPTLRPKKAIMIWHAIQGGKYIGLDEKTSYYKPEYADLMDYIVVAGHGGIDMFHQCTGVPKEKILNLGMPRTDRYIGKRKGDGKTDLAGKRAYLFAPTFRNSREPPYPPIDWDLIDRQLMDDEIFVVKAHPYGRQFDIGKRRHIIEAPKMDISVNYLYDADVVITDYSSIIFDAYLLGKPAVLFEKEKGYVSSRGMYLKYPDEYCSRFATDERELIHLARFANGLKKTERDCLDYVADMCDGHSCERICKLIEEVNDNV